MFWFKPQLRSLSIFRCEQSLSFLTTTFLLILGLSQVIVPMQPIVVTIGDDIILPCHLEPATDAVAMTCEWSRSDLNPRFVHVWHEREELVINQHPSYKGRTSLSTNKLKLGDISLKLSGVKLSDNGTYKCFIPELRTESTIKLVVDDFFNICSSSALHITIGLLVVAVVITAAVCVIWKWRHSCKRHFITIYLTCLAYCFFVNVQQWAMAPWAQTWKWFPPVLHRTRLSIYSQSKRDYY
uniref:Ig-like domain-containing protein n=1 Tax=Lates calcarifer TaxID=8187 RepID=A0A4W6EFV6_LATCA